MDGQLGDFDGCVIDFLDDTSDVVPVVRELPDSTPETTPPRKHRDLFLSIHQEPDVRDNILGVITRDVRTPTSTDAFSTVDEDHWEDGKVMRRFDQIVVILEVIEEGIVVRVENCSRDGSGFSKDIPGRGVVLSSLVSGSELSVGKQEVEVIAADIILSQVDNCHGQTLLSVVVSGMFGDITDELCHLR